MNDKAKTDPATETFVARAGSTLNAEVEGLDAATLSKLNQARQEALAVNTDQRIDWVFGWSALGGTVAASLLIAVLWLGDTPENQDLTLPVTANTADPGAVPVNSEISVSDLEMFLAEESFEMLEDLDFYTWMEADSYELMIDEGFAG